MGAFDGALKPAEGTPDERGHAEPQGAAAAATQTAAAASAWRPTRSSVWDSTLGFPGEGWPGEDNGTAGQPEDDEALLFCERVWTGDRELLGCEEALPSSGGSTPRAKRMRASASDPTLDEGDIEELLRDLTKPPSPILAPGRRATPYEALTRCSRGRRRRRDVNKRQTRRRPSRRQRSDRSWSR